MSVLLLRLAGVTQGWDVRRDHRNPIRGKALTHRGGYAGPTHSGVVGLLGCALGRERGSDLSDLQALEVMVREDQAGRGRSEFRTKPRVVRGRVDGTRPMLEWVLDDAIFLVGVQGPEDLLQECAAALLAPRWPLYLGRREYPPTLPILLGVVEGDIAAVVSGHEWLAAPWYQARPRRTPVMMWRAQRWATRGHPDIPAPPGHSADERFATPLPERPRRSGQEPDWFGEVAAADPA